MKNNKKAFTIVELVIVIAVIAILAAVLIPTFSSLIEKANINSDTAAVKQMNTYLAAHETANKNQKVTSWQEAVKVLNKSNLDAQDYKALSSEHYLVFDSSLGRVLYVRSADKAVIYPEEYADLYAGDQSLEETYGKWVSLAGKMIADDSWRNKTQDLSGNFTSTEGSFNFGSFEGTNFAGSQDAVLGTLDNLTESEKAEIGYNTYFGDTTAEQKLANLAALAYKNDATVSSGLATFGEFTVAKINNSEKLVDFAEYIDKNENGKNTTLVITGDIELEETEWKPFNNYYGSIDGAVLNAETNEVEAAEIKGLKMTDATAEVSLFIGSDPTGGNYYYGFISVFSGSYLGNLNFENVNIDKPGLSYSDAKNQGQGKIVPDGHMTAAVVGNVSNNEDIDMLIENITVSGTVKGLSRVAGLFGVVGHTSSNDGTPGVTVGSTKNSEEHMTAGSITIRNCVNNANVSTEASVRANYQDAGGIIGRFHRIIGGNLVVENCTNNGTITGGYAAGIAGETNQGGTYLFKNCVNNGEINGVCTQVLGTASPHSKVKAAGITTGNKNTIKLENCKVNANIKVSAAGFENVNVYVGQYLAYESTINSVISEDCEFTGKLYKNGVEVTE